MKDVNGDFILKKIYDQIYKNEYLDALLDLAAERWDYKKLKDCPSLKKVYKIVKVLNGINKMFKNPLIIPMEDLKSYR